MPRKLTTEEFIDNAKQVHTNKYDYSLVEYVGTRNKVKVVCISHGVFLVTPNDHVSKFSGCPVCSNRKKHTTREFIERARRTHGNKYDYSLVKYTCGHNNVKIICPIHGEFKQVANSHLLQKAGCNKCSNINKGKVQRKPTKQFITTANQIHNNKYDYSLVEYKTTRAKVKILCPEHGAFEQTPNNHTSKKQGCPRCWAERRKLISKGGYTETYFNTFPEQRDIPATLYLIHAHRETDNCLKIGITIRTIKERFSASVLRKSDYNIITLFSCTLYEAFYQEQRILKELKDQQYWPNYLNGGKTECFKYNKTNIQTILSLMSTPIP